MRNLQDYLRSFINEADDNPTGGETKVAGNPKFADVFEVKEDMGTKIIVKIKDENNAKNEIFAKNVTKNKDGSEYFIENENETYQFSKDLIKTCANIYPKAQVKEKEQDDNPYEHLTEGFKKLGHSLCLLVISGMTGGKMNKSVDVKSDKIAGAVENNQIMDRYDIIFKNIKGLDKEYFDSHQVYDIMDDMAARAAYFEAKDADKLSDSVEYVERDDEDKIKSFNIDTIKGDGATKSFYEKTLSEYQDAFDEGVKTAKEEIEKNKSGGKIKDPITSKTIEVPEESAIKQFMKSAGASVGSMIGDVLGITDGKDIYSRMIRGVVNQFKDGSTVRKLLKKAAAARFNDLKKLKRKMVKGHVMETLKAIEMAKKNGGIPE